MKSVNHDRPGGAFMPPILRRIAPLLGAQVLFEPGYEVVGCIRFPNGRQSYFWHNKFNLNSVASARIAQDKGYAGFFLKAQGFRVPDSGVFLEDRFQQRNQCGEGQAAARAFAMHLDWQVFLKPLRKSGGDGIVRICGEAEFDTLSQEVFDRERKVLVQQACAGRDYRIVVLDGEVISAYERVPLTVTGDGRHTILQLLGKCQDGFTSSGRDTIIDANDPRIASVLGRRGLSPESVIPAGVELPLLDVANLSCGGTTQVVTNSLHPDTAALAAKIAEALDLRFAGVDVLLEHAASPPGEYTILEVNSSPGLDHYSRSGPEHEQHVDDLYLKVLRAIERGPA